MLHGMDRRALHKVRRRSADVGRRAKPANPSASTPAGRLFQLAKRVPAGATLRRQRVQCGKPGCRRWHGPYWYAFWFAGGRTRSAYIGKDARLSEFLRERGAPELAQGLHAHPPEVAERLTGQNRKTRSAPPAPSVSTAASSSRIRHAKAKK